MSPPSSSSTAGLFSSLAGVPSLDLLFGRRSRESSRREEATVSAYPPRDTHKDTWEAYQQVADPGLRYLQLCTRVLVSLHSLFCDEMIK